MIRITSTMLLCLALLGNAQLMHAQIDNKLFRKIKKESYRKAIAYGERKLQKLEGKKKYYRKGIPYHLGLGMVYKKAGDFKNAEQNY